MSSNMQILKYLWEDAKNHKKLKAKKKIMEDFQGQTTIGEVSM